LLLEEKEKEEMAAETYDRIIKSLTPLEWEDALGILSDNHEFMEEHLDRDRKRNINNLIKFFTRIVEGDNISSIQPETKKNLSEALAHYRQAERLIKELPENINVLFISELKIKNNLSQKLILEDRNKETLAQDMYNRVIESLSVSEWEDARNLLFDNRQFMEDYLDKERKKGIEKLADFFFDVNEGDKIMEKDPWSIKNIDGAITLYKRAEQKATNLPDGINVVFITDMKIDQGLNQQSLIEQKAHEQHAGETYDRIMAGLVPDKWEESRDLLYSNRKQLEDYLDEDLIRNLRKLFAVFREIDRVDSIRNEQPETVKNLDIIIGVYEKAGEKVRDLMPDIDVMFVIEGRIQECLNNKKAFQTRKKELLAAKKTDSATNALHVKPEVDAPVLTAIPDKATDRDELILMALKEFEAMDYNSSMNHFIAVFGKQINNIKKGGKKRVFGVLGLPVECRAEIVFLTELARLKALNKKNDMEFLQKGLEKINENIKNRVGPWAVIRDSGKRNKIRHHIAVFDVNSLK